MKIQIKNLFFQYNKELVLDNLNFTIHNTEKNIIIGPNGVGKSTFLKILSRVLSPYQGEIFLDDQEIRNIPLKKYSQKVSLMFSNLNFTYNHNVKDFILMGRYPYLNPFIGYVSEDFKKADEAMEITGVNHLLHKGVLELSSGELQLVLLAHVLTQDTEFILLDEPFAHLDLKHQYHIMDLLQQIKHKMILMVTHSVHHLEKIADHVILLKNKRLFKQGVPQKVLVKRNIKNLFDLS